MLGSSQASVIGAIMSSEPPSMSSLQPMTPPALDRLVKKSLAKEPEKRWQGASDLCDELKWIAEGGSQVTVAPTVAAKGIRTLGRRLRMEPGSRARRQVLRGDSQTGGNRRAERLGSPDGAAQFLRRSPPPRAFREMNRSERPSYQQSEPKRDSAQP